MWTPLFFIINGIIYVGVGTVEYKYKILDEAYYWMLSKQKNIEVRILNEKSEKIQIGDFITFNNIGHEGQFIKVKIIDKNVFDNVEDVLRKYDINHIMPNHTLEDIKETLIKIYGDEAATKKLVGFKFEYVVSDKG